MVGMGLRKWSFLLITVYLLSFDNTGALDCPKRVHKTQLEKGRKCRPRRCETEDVCQRKDECICDGLCGMSCINPKMRCKKTLTIENGAIVYSSKRAAHYNSTAKYTCDPGFVLDGNQVRTCRSDRTFSGQDPKCISAATEIPTVGPTEPPTEEPQPTTEPTQEPQSTTEPTEEPQPPVESTESPVMTTWPKICTEENKGHCECGDTSKGFTTYTFTVDGTKRCFTVYHPQSHVDKAIPVVISSQCYGKDRLGSLQMTNDRADNNKAAARYGFARIGISTPDGAWTFGNNGIVNDAIPMPCDESDSKDISYLKVIFNWIETHSDKYLQSQVYAEGFSQNSMFSAYLGFCFREHVIGIWQGGSGMALTGLPPTLPGAQAQCTASSFKEYKKDCMTEDPCTECQYWPIYPTPIAGKPMTHCIAEYDNDFVSSGRNNPAEQSSGLYMYVASESEGNDATLLRFSKSADETIPGNHKSPKNLVYWQVACWGLTDEVCTPQCQSSFIACVENENPSTALEQTEVFETCMEEEKFIQLEGCNLTCSPTLEMMEASEAPTTIKGSGQFSNP